MGRFLGWPVRRRQPRQVVLEDISEPLPDCAGELELLDGQPCCCLAASGSGIHDSNAARAATIQFRNGCGTG